MALRTLLCIGCLVGTAAGCSDGGGDPQEGACEPTGGVVAPGAQVGGIDYEVSGGLSGEGDGTSLQIAPDGAFTRHTMQRGTEQGRLDQATLDDLTGRARAAQFPTLCAIYGSAAADELFHDVSVQFDASTYTVMVSQFATPPDRLQGLIEALQAIVDRPLP